MMAAESLRFLGIVMLGPGSCLFSAIIAQTDFSSG
jgi:hypothetical protein